jgi:hypothetical protein
MKSVASRRLDPRTKAITAAMRRVAKRAEATARATGTKLYHVRDGKLVVERPATR